MPRRLRGEAMIGFPKSRAEAQEAMRLCQSRGALPSKGMLAGALQEQMDRFAQTGLPDRKTEGWRRFPIQELKKAGFSFCQSLAEGEPPKKAPEPLLPGSLVISVENGRPRALSGPEDGLKIFSWSEVLHGGAALDSERKRQILQALRQKRNSFCAFNSALSLNGWVIVADRPPGGRENFIEIQCLQSASGFAQGLNLRNFLFLQKNSSARIIETFYGQGGSPEEAPSKPFFLNSQTDCFLGENSRLSFFRIDRAGAGDFQINQLFAEAEKGASARFLSLSLSSGISRHLTDVSQRESAFVEARGLALLGGRCRSDHKTIVRHQGERGSSRQMLLAILFDSAQSVFNGVIKIARRAQKTSSSQLIKNLIFGEKAMAFSCPELDVEADDVQAAHGASVSSLRENREALFYLRSRGLGDFEALSLILSGRIKELLSFMDAELQGRLESIIRSRLEAFRDSARGILS